MYGVINVERGEKESPKRAYKRVIKALKEAINPISKSNIEVISSNNTKFKANEALLRSASMLQIINKNIYIQDTGLRQNLYREFESFQVELTKIIGPTTGDELLKIETLENKLYDNVVFILKKRDIPELCYECRKMQLDNAINKLGEIYRAFSENFNNTTNEKTTEEYKQFLQIIPEFPNGALMFNQKLIEINNQKFSTESLELIIELTNTVSAVILDIGDNNKTIKNKEKLIEVYNKIYSLKNIAGSFLNSFISCIQNFINSLNKILNPSEDNFVDRGSDIYGNFRIHGVTVDLINFLKKIDKIDIKKQ